MNKHDKLRVFTAFQHWLGTHYTNLPTDSGNMTERATRYLKENPKALDLFAVVGQSEQLIDFALKEGYFEGVPKGNLMGLIDRFENQLIAANSRTDTTP
jgi:hypothetical protein